MSPIKLLIVVASVIIAMTTVAYAALDVPTGKPEATPDFDYTSQYLFGFVTPLITAGVILFFSCQIILRKKRKPRKVNRQIQAV